MRKYIISVLNNGGYYRKVTQIYLNFHFAPNHKIMCGILVQTAELHEWTCVFIFLHIMRVIFKGAFFTLYQHNKKYLQNVSKNIL